MKALGYVFLFYVGFYFYRLAENHNKNKWLFAIIGISTYFFGVIVYPLYLRFFNSEDIEGFDISSISLKSFLVGFLFIFLLFQILNLVWNRKKKINKKEIDKIGKTKDL